MKKETEKKVLLNVRIPLEIDNKIRQLSAETGKTVTNIVTEILRDGQIVLITQGKDIAERMFKIIQILQERDCEDGYKELVNITNSLVEILDEIRQNYIKEKK